MICPCTVSRWEGKYYKALIILYIVVCNNIINGDAGDDLITTGTGNDTIDGGDDNDNITSTGGTNIVDGGAGNDIINLGGGADTVDGGTGSDSCDFLHPIGACKPAVRLGDPHDIGGCRLSCMICRYSCQT